MNIKFNRTKIIATLGPASSNYEMMKSLVAEGVDIFRLNFSHGDYETHQKNIDLIRQLNTEFGTSISILQDLQGPKIRTGLVKDNGVKIVAGQKLIMTNDHTVEGNSEKIGVSYKALAQDVKPGEIILMDDGNLQVKVLSSNNVDELVTEVIYGGILKSKKGVNMPFSDLSVPALTEKDLRDLEFGLENYVDWIALSFVRTAKEIIDLKRMIAEKGVDARVIAKIEKPEAVANIDEIIAASDAIMVARGDLGVEIIMEEVPLIQKTIVSKCNRASKPVIIATQMMESMIENPRPTRAETNDVANAVMDGADVVMLSAETAAGKYPIETIQSMNKTIQTVEELSDKIYHKFDPIDLNSQTYFNDNVIATACNLARHTNAKGIVGMTRSGYTAFEIAKHRPKANIFIFTDNYYVQTRLNLIWGVRAFYYDKFTTTDETIEDIIKILKNKHLIASGDVLINTASMPIYEQQRTNTIKLSVVS